MSLLQAYLSLYISPWWPGEVNYLRKGGVGITRTKRQWQGCSVLDCDVKNGQTRCEYCHSCMCPPKCRHFATQATDPSASAVRCDTTHDTCIMASSPFIQTHYGWRFMSHVMGNIWKAGLINSLKKYKDIQEFKFGELVGVDKFGNRYSQAPYKYTIQPHYHT